MKEYYLEGMDGFEFEEMCAEVLEHRFQCDCDVTSKTNDGGKDIVIRAVPPVYVECKHFGDAKVGRPIIQKLHSAMSTAGANGMVIAPSGFAPTAKAYIKENGISVDLVDFEILKSWAAAAGIAIKYQRPVVSEYDVYEPSAPLMGVEETIRRKTRCSIGYDVQVLESKEEEHCARLFSVEVDKKFYTNDGSGVSDRICLSKRVMIPHMYDGELSMAGREPGERPAEAISDLKKEIACAHSASRKYVHPDTGAARTLKCPLLEKDVGVEYLGSVRFRSITARAKVANSVVTVALNHNRCAVDGMGDGFLCASCGKYARERGICKACGQAVCVDCVVKKGLLKWECRKCSR